MFEIFINGSNPSRKMMSWLNSRYLDFCKQHLMYSWYVQVVSYNLQLLPILMLLKCTLLGSLLFYYLSLFDAFWMQSVHFKNTNRKPPSLTLVVLIYFRTLRKWSAILGHSFSAWCWLPRNPCYGGQACAGQPAPCRKTKSKNHTSLS